MVARVLVVVLALAVCANANLLRVGQPVGIVPFCMRVPVAMCASVFVSLLLRNVLSRLIVRFSAYHAPPVLVFLNERA